MMTKDVRGKFHLSNILHKDVFSRLSTRSHHSSSSSKKEDVTIDVSKVRPLSLNVSQPCFSFAA